MSIEAVTKKIVYVVTADGGELYGKDVANVFTDAAVAKAFCDEKNKTDYYRYDYTPFFVDEE